MCLRIPGGYVWVVSPGSEFLTQRVWWGDGWELASVISFPSTAIAAALGTHFGNHWPKLTSVPLSTETHPGHGRCWFGINTPFDQRRPPNSASFSMKESILWQHMYDRLFVYLVICVLSVCMHHCCGPGHPKGFDEKSRGCVYVCHSLMRLGIQRKKKGSIPSLLLLKLETLRVGVLSY